MDWRKVPAFGARPEGNEWVIRPSAYGLVEGDQGSLAVVRTSKGIHLPGGGMEPGETPEDTIEREALEECGLIVRPGVWAVRAVQFVFSEPERTHFEKRSTFREGIVIECGFCSSEAGHELLWVNPDTAIQSLSHQSHRWAVEQWRSHKVCR